MKITYSSENINSFGGINFANLIINNVSVYKSIGQTMGQHGIRTEYLYSDLITDVNYNYRAILSNNPKMTNFEVVDSYHGRGEN